MIKKSGNRLHILIPPKVYLIKYFFGCLIKIQIKMFLYAQFKISILYDLLLVKIDVKKVNNTESFGLQRTHIAADVLLTGNKLLCIHIQK